MTCERSIESHIQARCVPIIAGCRAAIPPRGKNNVGSITIVILILGAVGDAQQHRQIILFQIVKLIRVPMISYFGIDQPMNLAVN